MTIEKLPSGSYRVRQKIDGIRHSVTVPYKPSKKEAFRLIEEKVHGTDKSRKSFAQCATEYIEGKRHTLSPTTIRSYGCMAKQFPDPFASKPIGDITEWEVQLLIDGMSEDGKKPKTVRNYNGFISAVFKAFRPDMVLNVKLPQKVENEAYMPSDEDIKRILDHAKGTDYEIPLRLACYGLRRSEVCALTLDDLDGNHIRVNKALVRTDENTWVTKTTKTIASTRTVLIDDYLAGLIREKGFYLGHPDSIYIYLQRTQNKLGIPNFPLHYLRHYFASTMHELGVPDAVIMASGGWKTDHVMKRVYRHAKNIDEQQRIMTAHMEKL